MVLSKYIHSSITSSTQTRDKRLQLHGIIMVYASAQLRSSSLA
ncbi:hypothetical protein HMPREF3192_01105 [Atopobium deltae]|uniref:Uncharacterized protein n=1 Tax=Atopobium deltae TaxID=1393034 RepID=A0A133XSG0_9ACTN|nr:hypothetical protein HMPREF3192_01105 [Atopobium deltae]